jgi:hypothetical protein
MDNHAVFHQELRVGKDSEGKMLNQYVQILPSHRLQIEEQIFTSSFHAVRFKFVV